MAEVETDEDHEFEIEYASTIATTEKLNVMQRYMSMANVNEVQSGIPSQCRAYFPDDPGGSGKLCCITLWYHVPSARHLKVHNAFS